MFEETRLEVVPEHMLFVEDIIVSRYRVLKIWFACKVSGGELCMQSKEARAEGIVSVGWYDRVSLTNKVVFPPIVLKHDWRDFAEERWRVQYSGLTWAQF